MLNAGRLTCPECGRSGSLLEVAEPQPPPAPPIYRTLWLMGRWTTGLLAFALLLGLAARLSGLGVLADFGFLPALAALLVGLGVPLLVAAEIASVHSRDRRRAADGASLAIAGIAINIVQCIVAVIIAVIAGGL